MNRRDFIKAALAIPAIAALPAPLQAAEELLEGFMYVTQSYIDGNGIGIVETWRRAGGKIWRVMASENQIISITEHTYCPYIQLPPWRDYVSSAAEGSRKK